MRFALLTTVVALGALACGKKGDQNQTQTQTAPPAPPAGTAPATPTGPVVEVKMTGNGTTKANYEPKSITIAPGSTVRTTSRSGRIRFLREAPPPSTRA